MPFRKANTRKFQRVHTGCKNSRQMQLILSYFIPSWLMRLLVITLLHGYLNVCIIHSIGDNFCAYSPLSGTTNNIPFMLMEVLRVKQFFGEHFWQCFVCWSADTAPCLTNCSTLIFCVVGEPFASLILKCSHLL